MEVFSQIHDLVKLQCFFTCRFLMPGKCKLRPESLEIFTYYLMSVNFVYTTVLTLEAFVTIFFQRIWIYLIAGRVMGQVVKVRGYRTLEGVGRRGMGRVLMLAAESHMSRWGLFFFFFSFSDALDILI